MTESLTSAQAAGAGGDKPPRNPTSNNTKPKSKPSRKKAGKDAKKGKGTKKTLSHITGGSRAREDPYTLDEKPTEGSIKSGTGTKNDPSELYKVVCRRSLIYNFTKYLQPCISSRGLCHCPATPAALSIQGLAPGPRCGEGVAATGSSGSLMVGVQSLGQRIHWQFGRGSTYMYLSWLQWVVAVVVVVWKTKTSGVQVQQPSTAVEALLPSSTSLSSITGSILGQ
ncbi:hypothetical protein B0T21DRAFT_441445 [Apiosordaria backusii]|uniref:Uncharacterized protein n=1 Tax=Apiosordaria backusii TaxID=314023 RepID=A0AA40EE97_9PEZI|nr:hypothetical protein B0T21DRAFT_441445 [Apiosordaria backusii]